MVLKYVKFPSRLKFSKKNPLVDFYEKCLTSANYQLDLTNVQVWAFSVSKKDYKTLENLVKKHVKKNYPYLPYKKIQLTVGMTMLDFGPRLAKDVEDGIVRIEEEQLFGN
jgi:hypothetical protein